MDGLSLLPILKVTGIFVLVVLLLRLSLQIGAALGIGAVALGVAFTMPPSHILHAVIASLVHQKTLLLILIVSLIIILNTSMDLLGQMEALLGDFRKRIGGSRWGLVVFPSLIGLLPMPGGAVFSAPMLDAFDEKKQVAAHLKSFLNYWFRHIWEFWWPLYPGVLLTCTIADLDLWSYVLLSLPMTAVALAGGLLGIMQVPQDLTAGRGSEDAENASRVWSALVPLLLCILPGVGFGLFHQFMDHDHSLGVVPRESGLVLGILGAVGWAWSTYKISPGQIRTILVDPKLPKMWLAIGGAFAFKGVLEQSGASQQVGNLLLQIEIPVFWVAILLPFIVGVISGWTVAFVSVSFPILVPLIGAMASSDLKLPLMILAFASGSVGQLISPLHLCLILTNEYFKAPLSAVYGQLWLPVALLMGSAIGYYLILKGLLMM